MSDLSKSEAKAAIKSNLSNVRSALSDLDKLTTKAGKLEEELVNLKSQEAAILKDESRSDDDKLPDFVSLRGSIDLKQAAITMLRGEPARGANAVPVPGKIDAAKVAVSKAGEAAAQLLSAYHAALLVAFQSALQSATAAFINAEDMQDLMSIAGRHPNVRQLRAFSVPTFDKNWHRGYEDAISTARTLPVIWLQLTEAADGVPGELSVSIPDAWL